MRLLAAVVTMVVSSLAVVSSEEHPFQDAANGLMALEAPTHRQIDFEDDQGFYLQSQDDVGFFKDNKPVRRPNRQPKRKPKRRPNRIPAGGRPQRQTRPQRESVEDGPSLAGGVRGGKGPRGRTRGREPGVSGFMKSFRRLIRQGL